MTGDAEAIRPNDERTDAREQAVILLYEAEQRSTSAIDLMTERGVASEDLARSLLEGVESSRNVIDASIEEHARGWALDRMPALDRAILRLAIYELMSRPDVPIAVVIDEAVELAKRFSTDDSGRFVNGVLAAVAKRHAPLGNDDSVTTGHPRFIFSRVREQLRAVTGWGWALFVLCVAHAAWMTWIAYDLHYGLGTFSYDVGLYDQGLWLMSRGHAPFVTFMGRNLMGDHASLILVFLIPLYWVVPGTMTLLVVQAIVVAAGAIPIYLLTKHVLNSGAMALCAAFIWLANPALNGGAMENFHPDSFLALFIPLCFFAAFTKKWKLFAVAVALSLLVKEDVLLVMVPLGLYVAWRIDRRRGLLAAGASIVATVLGMFVMMRHLIGVPTRNGWRIPFGGVGGFLKEIFVNPTNVAKYLWEDGRPMYLFKMGAPFAGLFFVAPSLALIAVPVLASNVVSAFWYQHQIEYHYSIVAIAPLVVATVFGVKKMGPRWGKVAMSAVVSCSLVTFIFWGIHPLAAHPRVALTAGSPVAQTGLDIIKNIPDDAVVSAYDPLTAHLGHRRQIYFFPNPFRALYYGVDDSLDGQELPAAKDVEYVILPKALGEELRWDWARVSGQFEEIDSNQFWQVFKRRQP